MSSDNPSDFDFLYGSWQVTNRKLESPDPDEPPVWREFSSTMTSRPMLAGLGNLDEYHFPDFPGRGEYHALALRLFDPQSGLWRIWWASNPGTGDVGIPVSGRFHDGEGHFEADDFFNDRPIIVRFKWSEITPDSARWEQSFSFDRTSFTVNWIMRFRHLANGEASR